MAQPNVKDGVKEREHAWLGVGLHASRRFWE
jgi:hypothetical protein